MSNISDKPSLYIVAVDFDGTLVKNKFPEIGEINHILVEQLKLFRAADPNNRIVLWTCRNNSESLGNMLDQAVEACRAVGLEFDAVNQNVPEIISEWGGDTRKVFANEYIDDRAVDFAIPSDWLETEVSESLGEAE